MYKTVHKCRYSWYKVQSKCVVVKHMLSFIHKIYFIGRVYSVAVYQDRENSMCFVCLSFLATVFPIFFIVHCTFYMVYRVVWD